MFSIVYPAEFPRGQRCLFGGGTDRPCRRRVTHVWENGYLGYPDFTAGAGVCAGHAEDMVEEGKAKAEFPD